MHACVCALCVRVVCVYTYIHTYIHTHIHTCMYYLLFVIQQLLNIVCRRCPWFFTHSYHSPHWPRFGQGCLRARGHRKMSALRQYSSVWCVETFSSCLSVSEFMFHTPTAIWRDVAPSPHDLPDCSLVNMSAQYRGTCILGTHTQTCVGLTVQSTMYSHNVCAHTCN
jgi:hypothetical protein